MLDEIIHFELKYYDVCCFLPIEFNLVPDGARSNDVEYRKLVDDTFASVPLRLLLGADALETARIKLQELKNDFDTWEKTTLGTGF